jgi:hypothetical protein
VGDVLKAFAIFLIEYRQSTSSFSSVLCSMQECYTILHTHQALPIELRANKAGQWPVFLWVPSHVPKGINVAPLNVCSNGR